MTQLAGSPNPRSSLFGHSTPSVMRKQYCGGDLVLRKEAARQRYKQEAQRQGATICHIPLCNEMNYSHPAIYTGEKDGDVSARYRTFFSGYRSNYTDYLVR